MTEAHREYFRGLLDGRMGEDEWDPHEEDWWYVDDEPDAVLSLFPEAGLDLPQDGFVPPWARDVLHHPWVTEFKRALRLRYSPWRTRLVKALADPTDRKALAMEGAMQREAGESS